MDQTQVSVGGSKLGTVMQSLLMQDDIQPGSDASYQLCKELYLFHPLGAKLVETPVKLAQSQPRAITVPGAPETALREAFVKEWDAIKADYHIRGTMYQARIYGAGSLIMGTVGVPSDQEIDFWKLAQSEIFLNVLDPLNTAGSLVLHQDPNAPDFQKHGGVTAAGQKYHRSRSVVVYNEQPVYIAYTSSAFGYVGRSVYQRALFPLKSFIQSMITDDMVTRKASLLVAMMKGAGSIVNAMMQKAAGIKRQLLKEAGTDNVISIDVEEKIESINLQNTDTAMTTARSNILRNIATAADMPAKIIEQESFAEGFGEGTEDTKNVVRYVNGVRKEMRHLYDFMDRIVQHRAWNEDFFNALQADSPDLYPGRAYREVFMEWRDAFSAEWPSLLEEPESEQSKMEKVKLEGLVSVYQSLASSADPENRARLAQWMQDNVNEFKKLFKVGLVLDIDALATYEPPPPAVAPGPGGAETRSDSKTVRSDSEFVEADHPRQADGKFSSGGGSKKVAKGSVWNEFDGSESRQVAFAKAREIVKNQPELEGEVSATLSDLGYSSSEFKKEALSENRPHAEVVNKNEKQSSSAQYHRYTRGKSADTGPGYMMFSNDQTRVENAYGKNHHTTNEFDFDKDEIANSEDLVGEIESALNEETDVLEDLGATASELAAEASPDDIVDSAGLWDNQDLVMKVWEKVLEPRGIKAVKTPDGLIVFDPKKIKSHGVEE